MEDTGITHVHRGGQKGLHRRPHSRHDHRIGQRRLRGTGRTHRRQRGVLCRTDERTRHPAGHGEHPFRQLHRAARPQPLHHPGRHSQGDPRPHRRVSPVLPHLFPARVHLQRHHPKEPQPASVARPFGGRGENRSHPGSRILPGWNLGWRRIFTSPSPGGTTTS